MNLVTVCRYGMEYGLLSVSHKHVLSSTARMIAAGQNRNDNALAFMVTTIASLGHPAVFVDKSVVQMAAIWREVTSATGRVLPDDWLCPPAAKAGQQTHHLMLVTGRPRPPTAVSPAPTFDLPADVTTLDRALAAQKVLASLAFM